MTSDRLDKMADDVQYIRTRLDQHITRQHARDLDMEGRLKEIEVRSGLWGLVAGLLSGIGIHLARR